MASFVLLARRVALSLVAIALTIPMAGYAADTNPPLTIAMLLKSPSSHDGQQVVIPGLYRGLEPEPGEQGNEIRYKGLWLCDATPPPSPRDESCVVVTAPVPPFYVYNQRLLVRGRFRYAQPTSGPNRFSLADDAALQPDSVEMQYPDLRKSTFTVQRLLSADVEALLDRHVTVVGLYDFTVRGTSVDSEHEALWLSDPIPPPPSPSPLRPYAYDPPEYKVKVIAVGHQSFTDHERLKVQGWLRCQPDLPGFPCEIDADKIEPTHEEPTTS